MRCIIKYLYCGFFVYGIRPVSSLLTSIAKVECYILEYNTGGLNEQSSLL